MSAFSNSKDWIFICYFTLEANVSEKTNKNIQETITTLFYHHQTSYWLKLTVKGVVVLYAV